MGTALNDAHILIGGGAENPASRTPGAARTGFGRPPAPSPAR